MAKEELFESTFSRMVVEGYGAFPVRRGRLDKQVLRSAWDALEAQGALGMFPEGKRSGDGHMLEAEDGAARIASRKGAQLLPVGIVGSNQVKGVSVIIQRPRVTVTIGRPFSLPLDDHKPRRERLREHTSLIVQRIAELLPESHQPKTTSTLALSDAD